MFNVILFMKKHVEFYARKKVKKHVSFKGRKGKVSFTAKVPSKRRKKVVFYAR